MVKLRLSLGTRDKQGQDIWLVYADWISIGRVQLYGARCYLPTCYSSEDAELPFEHTLRSAAESVFRRWQSDQLNTGS